MSGEGVHWPCAVRTISQGPLLHFYGYYLTTPWDASDRRLLAHRVPSMRSMPSPSQPALVGFFDEGGEWHELASTRTWNWQQGSMLQWLGENAVVFNTRHREEVRAMVVDVGSGEQREYGRPVYALAPDGAFALTLDFGRLQRMRPVCGYPGIRDPYEDQEAPESDGIHRLDLEAGGSQLVLSLARMAAAHPEPSMVGAHHWFNHLLISPSGARFACLHRWRRPDSRKRHDRLFVANTDGSEVAWIGHEDYASHFDWCDERTLLVYMQHGGRRGYFFADVTTGELQPFEAEGMERNGHCTLSPDRRWILTDTYPDPESSRRSLILYHLPSSVRVDVGSFDSDPGLTGELRCDLHPRWNHAGDAVCIDSTHTGSRQMHVIDVAPVVTDARFSSGGGG